MALVAGLRARNPAALAAFHDRYKLHVARTLVRVLGADRELGDLHHDVFLRAIDGLEDLRDPQALKAWLTSIAIFTARSCILRRTRRSWLRFLPWHDLPEVEAPIASEEVSDALRATYLILEQMPVDERIAFCLRFIDSMELTEVAAAMKVSLATIKRRLSRAEKSFLTLAQEQPALDEWLKGGARWGTPKAR